MKRSKTELKLLEAGKKLFWKYGFKRVTVEDICSEAEASKTSFYRSFTNKTDIARQILSDQIEQGIEEYKTILHADIPFIQKLEQTTLMKIKSAENMSIEFLQELSSQSGSDLNEFLNDQRKVVMDMIVESFSKAQEEGDIRKDLNIQLLPIISEHITQLAYDPRMIKIFSSTEEIIKEITTFFFYGIVSHPEHP